MSTTETELITWLNSKTAKGGKVSEIRAAAVGMAHAIVDGTPTESPGRAEALEDIRVAVIDGEEAGDPSAALRLGLIKAYGSSPGRAESVAELRRCVADLRRCILSAYLIAASGKEVGAGVGAGGR